MLDGQVLYFADGIHPGVRFAGVWPDLILHRYVGQAQTARSDAVQDAAALLALAVSALWTFSLLRAGRLQCTRCIVAVG